MPTVTATGYVSWPGAVANGSAHVLHVTYTWTSNTSVNLTIWLTGGCDGSAGTGGKADPGNYGPWGEGTLKINGTTVKSGMYIAPYTASETGYNAKAYSASSSFTIAYSYRHQYSVTVTCSESVTIPYSPPTYTVSYNANGHGTAPSSQPKTHGTTLTLRPFISDIVGSDNTVTITGNANGGSWSGSNGSATWATTYHQTYWNTASNGSGTNYSSSGNYTANADATLYAIWTSSNQGTSYALPTGTPTKASTTGSSKTVTINANGGTCSITTLTSNVTTTYSFKGWFTATSGGTQRTTSSRVTAAETIYAQYEATAGPQSSVTLPTVTQCTKEGAVLSGFSTDSEAIVPSYSPGSSYTPSASVTLYAIWSEAVTSTYQGKARGFVTVYQSNDFHKYVAFVKVGTTWRPAIPYVYYDGRWMPAGQTGEIMVEFLTSNGENFITSDGKTFMVRKS